MVLLFILLHRGQLLPLLILHQLVFHQKPLIPAWERERTDHPNVFKGGFGFFWNMNPEQVILVLVRNPNILSINSNVGI